MANTRNNFKYFSGEDIRRSINEIQPNAMSAYILPIYVMLDLSGSMYSISDKALHILENIKNEFSDDKCPCDAYLILSVIYNCRNKEDIPEIVYSGFIDDFDFASFKKEVKECYGLTPLVNALKQVLSYGNILIDHLDSVERVHSCPVNIFITDYIENVSNDEECHAVIETIQQEIENEKQLAIEFVLTESQAIDMGVDLSKTVSFGGFRCRYNEKDITNLINALKLSSSTVTENGRCRVPRSDINAYNEQLRRTLITKMHEYWDHYYN